MNYTELEARVREKRSFLCVGLDTDEEKIPRHLAVEEDPTFAFNRAIVESTAPFAVAYKLNTAFYECRGAAGWRSMQRTVEYIKENHPDLFVIADAKRGDIGNTAGMYARAFLEEMPFDAITVAPYMGEDSVIPFTRHAGKWVILLALTSNRGASDFQFMEERGEMLYERVLRRSSRWGDAGNMMYVAGATKAGMLAGIRAIVPDHFLLVPGVGAQGGSLEEVARHGMNDHCGLLVNSSRGIIFADATRDFARGAMQEARALQREMEALLAAYPFTGQET
ncbi:MAG: orotidine-5'-phosphate decarboxylase [Odoribacteraceae bacterium]|jgi:orotidine-5'-phosphate decarboxylase|nr:orotidine-5'-phosphate decarboxylase [Odoribacteraceae bacterium]